MLRARRNTLDAIACELLVKRRSGARWKRSCGRLSRNADLSTQREPLPLSVLSFDGQSLWAS
jgi:hypothetical protein